MTSNKTEDYTENTKELGQGHEDTRHKNFECETPDKNLRCDPGLDVAG
jgi:hypothetical protein